MVLKKASTLFERDEKGTLIPQEVELLIDETDDKQLEYKGEKIIIIPMTRGEVKKISIAALIEDAKSEESKDLDDELILKYCIAPKYTAEEVKHLQAHFCTMIVNTIMLHSGISIGPKKSKEKSVEEKVETEFSKN